MEIMANTKFGLKKEQVLNFWFELWLLRFSLALLPDANSILRWQTKLRYVLLI